VCLFVYLNYFTGYIIDWKNSTVYTKNEYFFYLILYGSPFLLGYLFSAINHSDYAFLRNKKFWFLFAFALGVFIIRSCSHQFIQPYWNSFMHKWTHSQYYFQVIGTVLRALIVFGAIYLYWIFGKDRKSQAYYGFRLKDFNTRPYFIMLLLMLPLIIAASTQSDFLGHYPRGATFPELDPQNSEHWWFYGSYELFYGLGFFGIEFFFRGFLVLAFLEIAGPRVILPMALFYVTIHFGKPMGELISSLFGGTILGIVTYYSRSIIGGIIVHVGIAWLMELGALIGNLSNHG
jgi:hypothetical protein